AGRAARRAAGEARAAPARPWRRARPGGPHAGGRPRDDEKVREDAIRGRYGARFVRVTTARPRRPDELMTTLLAAFSSRPRLTPRPHLALPRPTHPRPST